MSESVVKKTKYNFKLSQTKCRTWHEYANKVELNADDMLCAFYNCPKDKLQEFLVVVFNRYLEAFGPVEARFKVGLALRKASRDVSSFRIIGTINSAYPLFLLDNGMNLCRFLRERRYDSVAKQFIDKMTKLRNLATRTLDWTRDALFELPFPIREQIPHLVLCLRKVLPPQLDRWMYSKIISMVIARELGACCLFVCFCSVL